MYTIFFYKKYLKAFKIKTYTSAEIKSEKKQKPYLIRKHYQAGLKINKRHI